MRSEQAGETEAEDAYVRGGNWQVPQESGGRFREGEIYQATEIPCEHADTSPNNPGKPALIGHRIDLDRSLYLVDFVHPVFPYSLIQPINKTNLGTQFHKTG